MVGYNGWFYMKVRGGGSRKEVEGGGGGERIKFSGNGPADYCSPLSLFAQGRKSHDRIIQAPRNRYLRSFVFIEDHKSFMMYFCAPLFVFTTTFYNTEKKDAN